MCPGLPPEGGPGRLTAPSKQPRCTVGVVGRRRELPRGSPGPSPAPGAAPAPSLPAAGGWQRRPPQQRGRSAGGSRCPWAGNQTPGRRAALVQHCHGPQSNPACRAAPVHAQLLRTPVPGCVPLRGPPGTPPAALTPLPGGSPACSPLLRSSPSSSLSSTAVTTERCVWKGAADTSEPPSASGTTESYGGRCPNAACAQRWAWGTNHLSGKPAPPLDHAHNKDLS